MASPFSSLSVAVLLFSLVSVSAWEDDFGRCERVVKSWATSPSSRESNGIKEEKLTLKDLLFFLHVPRTGGRTYFHCFLRKLYTPSEECPRSYDKLRLDPRKPNCKLMVTHDDYSLISKLPKGKTSVVTILRSPVDRVFSTYEFSVEVASRFLIHPNLSSVLQTSRSIRPKSRGVSTLDIWPWKFLVPWMRQDLFERRDARVSGRLRKTKEVNNPYDMEDMVMPLQEYINDPMAHEIIHNGATFQVAGLTNNSYLKESHDVRNCVRKYPELGHFVLEVAKNRLDHMLYVGLTEEHRESATMFVNMVGAQVLSQSETSNTSAASEEGLSFPIPDSETNSSRQDKNSTRSQQAEVPPPDNIEQMTAGRLMEAYGSCISSLRKSQSVRRTASLKNIAPANFSKEARVLVPKRILDQILSLNSLDVELYNHARKIFLQQQEHLMKNAEDISMITHGDTEEEYEERCSNLFGCSSWKILLGFIIVAIIAFVIIVSTRRRSSKLKI